MWLHKIDIYKDEMETAITKSLLMNNVQKKNNKNKGQERTLVEKRHLIHFEIWL